jgi:sugar lactone lactonase YvrE
VVTTRLQPVRWRAPRAPRRARQLSGDHLLDPVERLELPGCGPEDVVLDAEGRLLAGLEDGRVVRVSRDGRLIETLADTGGRPLGLEALPGGGLLICDDRRGLLRLDPDGRLETLVDTVDGEPLTFASNAGDDRLYLGSLTERAIGVLPLP